MLRNLVLLNRVGLGSEVPNISLLWQSTSPLCLVTLLQLNDLGDGPTKASAPAFLLVQKEKEKKKKGIKIKVS